MLLNSTGHQVELSASVISASPTKFFESIRLLEDGPVDSLHIDVMDGEFVPRFGIYPEMVLDIAGMTSLPIDIHMMVADPHAALRIFKGVPARRIVPHLESTPHIHRLISEIREAGLQAGVAVNPGTSLHNLLPILEEVDQITIMAINPGIVGHKLIQATLSRVVELRSVLENRGFSVRIEIDGGVTMENFSKLLNLGVDSLVVGAGTVFRPENSVQDNLTSLIQLARGSGMAAEGDIKK